MSEAFPQAQMTQGQATVAEADQDEAVIAAVTGKVLRLMRGYISITLAATGGGGLAALEDGVGGTVLFQIPAAAVGSFTFDFGPRGFPLTSGTALNLTVNGATTNEATAICTATAYVL